MKERIKMVGNTYLSFQSMTEKKFLLLDDLFKIKKYQANIIIAA